MIETPHYLFLNTGLPRTPAERLDFVQKLMCPVDPDTGESLPPMITLEQARAMLECDFGVDAEIDVVDDPNR